MYKKAQPGYLIPPDLQQILPSIVYPYEERLLRGVYYKIRLGDRAWIATTSQNPQEINIVYPRTLKIPPGREAIVRSWEKFDVPNNMIITVSPDDLYITKGILLITREFLEPNSSGYVFFTLSNLSDDTIEIQQGEELASIFVINLGASIDAEHQEFIYPPQIPRLIKKEIETHPELVARVDEIEKSVAKALRNDHILIDLDIKNLPGLISPFQDSNLSPNGYQLCVGERADVFNPQKENDAFSSGRELRYISKKNPLVVRPGYTVVVRTLEQVILLDDMSLELFAMPSLSRRYLNFDGKVISPGYRGYIWCLLHNYGTNPCELELGEPILHAKFTKLGKASARPLGYGIDPENLSVLEIPESDIPEPPTTAWDDLVSLTKKVEHIESEVKDFRTTKQIIELVFMAGVAGILAGIFLSIFPLGDEGILSLAGLSQEYKSLAVILIIVIYLYIYLRARRRQG
jgi:deoxycytidine triphosphate deaminase